MAYENLKLVLAGMSREIYLAKILKDGTMSDSRRVVTEDCLRASAEWFMSNDKKMIAYGSHDEGIRPSLFFTKDKEKAERILKILEEGEDE